MLLAFKLAAAPALIFLLTLISRRFGPMVGGVFMGVPLLTGPISVFVALENGQDFAQKAAVANLVGQVSACLFCFCYGALASRTHWFICTLASIGVFLAATAVWNQFSWSFVPAIALLTVSIAVLTCLTKPEGLSVSSVASPRYEMIGRMALSAAFILLITFLSKVLGSRLGGLIAPFPVFVLIMSVFTHLRSGPKAVLQMVRGVVVGSFSFAAFFSVIALWPNSLGITATYGLAVLGSLIVSGVILLVRLTTSQGRLAP